jgi:cell cycle protein kinase DBF2
MSNFITNLFPSTQSTQKQGSTPATTPSLQSRTSHNDTFGERPSTPGQHNFITPVSTPQGSPSKNRHPPGANDLPNAFENAMKLNPVSLGSPTKSSRPLTANSPGRQNALAMDESYFTGAGTAVDDSVVHKAVSPGSPLRKQGQENTPPASRQGQDSSQNMAAMSRQEHYQPKDQGGPMTSRTAKYNTQRGLTAEEREILNKPNVKRLANVTQLCRSLYLVSILQS